MSLPRALLLGTGGRLPFIGQIRRSFDAGGARLHMAARVAPGADPDTAWRAACALWSALDACAARDRYTLCRQAWEGLLALDRSRLGPQRGADLTLLLLCEDLGGELISGCGLGQLWGVDGETLRELVDPRHPLLGDLGLPEAPPKVLAPAQPAAVYLARAQGEAPAVPDATRLAALCGVNG